MLLYPQNKELLRLRLVESSSIRTKLKEQELSVPREPSCYLGLASFGFIAVRWAVSFRDDTLFRSLQQKQQRNVHSWRDPIFHRQSLATDGVRGLPGSWMLMPGGVFLEGNRAPNYVP